jgi:DNA-binding GntR family transcriptional regulator
MDGSVYAALHREIVSGELPPGSPLVESALASRFGVSRTPVREALRRLEQDGLAQRSGRGMRVREHSPDKVLEIYEVRVILEEAAARAVALHRTALDLTLLTRAYKEMLELESPDSAARVRANQLFHQRIWTASHSGTLIDLLERLNVHLHAYPETTLVYPGRWETALEEHERLLAAIREQRADDAAKIAAAHMTAARDIRLQIYADRMEEAAAD